MKQFIKIKTSNNQVRLINLAHVVSVDFTSCGTAIIIDYSNGKTDTFYNEDAIDTEKWEKFGGAIVSLEFERVKDEILKACGYE